MLECLLNEIVRPVDLGDCTKWNCPDKLILDTVYELELSGPLIVKTAHKLELSEQLISGAAYKTDDNAMLPKKL